MSQVRVYNRETSVVFRKTNESFGGLSNMAPGYPLIVNGHKYRTLEALYQSCRFPDQPHLQQMVIASVSPMTAKMISRKHKELTRVDWYSVRTKIMRWCLRVKLAQHFKSFGDLLLSTGDLSIVEYSSKDEFWGAK